MNNATQKKHLAHARREHRPGLLTGYRLRQKDKFWVDTLLSSPPLPQLLQWRGRVMYRYMDRLFSPIPICQMTEADSIALCDLRLEYFDRLARSITNQKVTSFFAKQLSNSGHYKLLDFGCGNGFYTEQLRRQIDLADITGVDLSERAIAAAQRAYPSLNWQAIGQNKLLPYNNESFDAIVCSYVMHFAVSNDLLAELSRILKPGGVFWFNVYHRKYYSAALLQRLRMNGFETVGLNNVRDLPRHHLIFKGIKL